ncbi:MAG TPA: hypothetical protein PLD88_10650, partial [Candidatus Berkiella sp.]|nr:hypothetical protein [Candidatus Berkiella sp.]
DLLREFEISADVWSVTSFNELRKDALAVARWNLLHPTQKPKQSYVEQCLEKSKGPIIAATDYMKLYTEQLAPFIKQRFLCLGTDGYGRSDTRERLRSHFEVDRYYIAYTAIKALVDEGALKADVAEKALKQWKIDPEKRDPVLV